MSDRFSLSHVDAWLADGAVVIERFFTPAEVAAVVADFGRVFGRSAGADEALTKTPDGQLGRFDAAQFAGLQAVPFDCSAALNLIGVHPALLAFARAALGCHDIRLYQNSAWAKFTGDADYDQPFHCDYVNHTLTAPSDDPRGNSVTFILFFTDVTEAHGPTHYVTRPDSLKIAGPEATLGHDRDLAALQDALAVHARSNAAPAGSVFAYGIDIWHRGTNMTEPGGARFAVTSTFKRAGDDAIGFHAWQFHHMKPWARIFDHATPDQLACFGVQRPGHPFWTEATLRRAQARYPGWDMSPYWEALSPSIAEEAGDAGLRLASST
jgi:hypothetical protein